MACGGGDSSPGAATTSCRLGGLKLSRSGLRVDQRRRRGSPLHSPRACGWRSSAACFSTRQRCLNPAVQPDQRPPGSV